MGGETLDKRTLTSLILSQAEPYDAELELEIIAFLQ